MFFGSNGLFGRNSSGQTTFAISSSSGAATFTGNITGGSNLTITGQGKFDGATAGLDGNNHAVVANNNGTSGRGGVFARGSSTVPGLTVYGALGEYAAVIQNTSDAGVSISAYDTALELTVSPGNRAINQTNGTATLRGVTVASGGLNVASGTTSVGAFSTSSTAQVTNLNADMVDGFHAASFSRQVLTSSGTANASTSRFGFYSFVSGVTTQASGNEFYVASVSDERLKDNIRDCKYGLEFINKLTPREFSWHHTPDIKNHGFIAQEVGEIDDVFVVKNPDGSLGIDQYGLLAALTKAVQELSSEVEHLKKQIRK